MLEVAILDVKPGLSHDFEATFTLAQVLISSMKGYVSHQLQNASRSLTGTSCWSIGNP